MLKIKNKVECPVQIRPSEEVSIPNDISSLPLDKVGKLHGNFCSWEQFIAGKLSEVSGKVSYLKQYVQNLKMQKKMGLVNVYESDVDIDGELCSNTMELARQRSEEDTLKSLLRHYKIGKEACSREMTRRIEILKSRNQLT